MMNSSVAMRGYTHRLKPQNRSGREWRNGPYALHPPCKTEPSESTLKIKIRGMVRETCLFRGPVRRTSPLLHVPSTSMHPYTHDIMGTRFRREQTSLSIVCRGYRHDRDRIRSVSDDVYQDENTRIASMSNEELRELAKQAHGSKGKSARRALNLRGFSVEKPKMRNKDRASKQKRDRQGWSKPQMRAAKARMCVCCRRIAAKDEMFRIFRTVTSEGQVDFHLDEYMLGESALKNINAKCETEEPNDKNTHSQKSDVRIGRSAYVCRDVECVEDACKKQRITRALRVSPRSKTSKEKSLMVMSQMIRYLPSDKVEKMYGPPAKYANISNQETVLSNHSTVQMVKEYINALSTQTEFSRRS